MEAIKFDYDTRRFFMPLGDDEARVDIRFVDDEETIWEILAVFVPETHRGKGLAEDMVKFVFERAKERGFAIKPTCPYVKNRFLEKYKEFNYMIVE
ncbi:MAG: GNAT family N-acetyltransferase [Candidatus Aenigmatarchaeota archaeon]|nr:N-acetyltransferase [Nanoarchaeota archaeon]